MKMDFDTYKLFDAKDMLVGRLASVAAKELLNGNNVVIINSEKALMSGTKSYLVKKYKVRLNLQEKENPEHSPYWPRRPDMLLKRIIRGMLPHNKPRGREAYRHLVVFIGAPSKFKDAKPVEIEKKDAKRMYVNAVSIEELTGLLGYRGN